MLHYVERKLDFANEIQVEVRLVSPISEWRIGDAHKKKV